MKHKPVKDFIHSHSLDIKKHLVTKFTLLSLQPLNKKKGSSLT